MKLLEKNQEIVRCAMISYIHENGETKKDYLHRNLKGVFSHATRWKHITNILNKTNWSKGKEITIDMLEVN